MLRYLLDTNIVIYVIKRRPQQALERFRQHDGRMAISAITLAELMHGVEKSAKAAQHYGAIRAALEMRGETIGVNELHIAAHARSEGLSLVTNNVGEFDRVDSLLLENWAI